MMLLSYLLSSVSLAVPLQMSQHGRLLDASGAALSGQHTLTFRIYDDLSAGSKLWEENLSVSFTNGYYSLVLGTNSNNPLDQDVLRQYPIYMELELDSNGPMSPRQSINSAPYAQMAGIAEVAESVDGGTVNASEVSINGSTVIDSNGDWVGNMGVDWTTDISNIPADLLDGDNDTLANLSCVNDGDVAIWSNAIGWYCDAIAASNLSESDVEGYITNGALDLHMGTTLGGESILTSADTLTPDWGNIQNVPAGFADDVDDDTQLSESEVENYVTNNAIDLHADTTIGGQPIGGSGSSLSSPAWLGETDQGSQFSSQDTPMVIPDNNSVGITSTRYIADSISIETMSMELQLTHPDVGEITITLTSPAGTTITVYDGEHSGDTSLNVTLGWDEQFSSGNLYSFYGEDSSGVWLLNAIDSSGATVQTGTLDSWTLYFNETWDGDMFVGNSIVAQESIATRGELRVEYGGALVMTNTDGVETLRLEAEEPATVLTTNNFGEKMYTQTSTGSNSASVSCNTGDVALSGGCTISYNDYRDLLRQNYPTISNGIPVGWTCGHYRHDTITAYVICLEL